MTGKQVRIIFAALAFLVIAYLGVTLIGNGRGSPGGPDFGAAVGPDAETLRITGPGSADTVVLARTEDGWTVNGYPADTTRVRQALADLSEAHPGRLAARTAANHARLGVAADSTRHVTLFAGGSPVVEFLLGRAGPDGWYVRAPGSDEVYTVPANSVRALDRSPDDWRDRLIAAVDTGSVLRIVVRRDDEPGPVTLTRRTADSTVTWVERDRTADGEAVTSLLAAATDLRAAGFPSDSVAFAVDFADPSAVLELYDSEDPGAAPRVSLLFRTAPDARDFLVRRASDPLVYRLGSAVVEKLLPARTALFPED